MARPYPTINTFDTASSQMSPASSSSTPISYRANVNRQKTKKWAEAKPADYGGDDWGDDDDYDLPPLPVSKPTGLRQQGQAIYGGSKPESPIDNKKSYGELPPIPAGSSRPRANSFEADDEKRNFSSGPLRQQSPAPSTSNPPATRFSQITGVPSVRDPSTAEPSTRDPSSEPPVLSISTQLPTRPTVTTGLRKAVPPPSGTPHPEMLLPGRTNSGDESSIASPTSDTRSTSSDFQTRRDFSPSAVPPPLQPRSSPAPQNPTEPPAPIFPTRKSSLSQSAAPKLSEITGAPQPWVRSRSSSPGAAAPAPATQGKPLPFVRPADIYRRMEEQREKERQSIDSSRPSMDSILGAKPRDASPPLEENQNSDSFGGTSRWRTGLEADDASDTGRLKTTLEPVKERKSEYGFEGFNMSDQAPSQTSKTSDVTDDHDRLEVEAQRRQSTSPKLPDLNRISGFGMDFFSRAILEDSQEPISHSSETPLKDPPKEDPVPAEEPTLRSQPSLGFRSVVNQAFDRTSESSGPAASASRTSSGVRRTDSESTGTTGISPIMSRVSSTAIPESRVRDTQNTPIMEAVNESSEAPGSSQHVEPIPDFKPGHRRDITAPSPGNSPARSPDLAKSEIVPQGQQAVLSESSTSESQADNEEPLQPPIQRQQSEDDYDVTPTTTTHPSPQSSSEAAVVGASHNDLTGATVEEREKDTHLGSRDLQESRPAPASNSLPTPDHAMEPSGTFDPQSLPKLEEVSTEAQLEPDTSDRGVFADSSEAPHLATKNTPIIQETDGSSGHVESPDLSEQESLHQGAVDERPVPSVIPQVIPSPGTDTEPDDEESDKLRNEIVERLTPKRSNASTRDDSMLFDHSYDQVASNQRESSSYLPSEYDNYWADSGEEETPAPLVTAPPQEADEEPIPSQAPLSIAKDSSAYSEPGPEPEPIQPLSTRRSEPTSHDIRPSLTQRFSWEASAEGVSALPDTNNEPDTKHESRSSLGVSHEDRDIGELEDSKPVVEQIESAEKKDQPHAEPLKSQPIDGNIGKDAALEVGGVVAAEYAHHAGSEGQPGKQVPLAEEKDPQVSSYAVTQTPPPYEHPAKSPQSYSSPTTEQHSNPSAPSAHRNSLSAMTSSQVAPTSRILSFEEIVAMKSPHQRIQAFEETRHRFAAMDSGLNNWMEALRAQFPEHANVTASLAGSGLGVPSGSRSKFSKATGASAPSLQQPYYQQYLNASNPTVSGPPPSRSGPSIPSGTQHGLSSVGGSKLSTQQVQAKGKEFLHTAGIFGGKAGKAGKGLLAKGKNKLRGAGGGDKTQPTTNTTATVDGRSSFGSPMTISRSTGQPDPSSQLSREFTPNRPPPRPQRPRTTSLTLDTDQPPLIYMQRGDFMIASGTMSGALPVDESPIYPRSQPPALRREPNGVPAVNGSDIRDNLGVLPPISKNQPSLDPNSATPITEQGFQYEEYPSLGFQSRDIRPPLPPDPLPPIEAASRSEDSKFGDGLAPDECENPSDNDWIMVSSGPESQNDSQPPPHPPTKDPPSKPKPEAISPGEALPTSSESNTQNRDRADSYTSVLDRPRGSYDFPKPAPAPPPITRPKSPPAVYFPSLIDSSDQEDSVQQTESEDDNSTSSFKGLPPIRRVSKLGFDYSPGRSKTRFPVNNDEEVEEEDDDEFHTPTQEHDYGEREDEIDAVSAASATAGLAHPEADRDTPQSNPAHSRQQSQTSQASIQDSTGPNIAFTGSSRHSQETIQQRLPNEDAFSRSPDPWRASLITPPSHASPGKLSDITISPQRFSYEEPGARTPLYNKPMPRPVWGQSQPPSSAQRYPGLFRPEQSAFEVPRGGGDIPSPYYQTNTPREPNLPPSQQTDEYQLPSLNSSMEMSNSISHEGVSFERATDSPHGYDDADSLATSEETKGQKKQRNSFFSGFNRASTGVYGYSRNRDSIVAHPAGSQMDLALSPHSPPGTPLERRRSLFGHPSPIEQRSKAFQIPTVSTSVIPEEPSKKKRFSGLGSMFGRSGNQTSKGSASGRPQAKGEVFHHARQLSEPPIQSAAAIDQPRKFLSRLTTGGDSSHSRQDSKNWKKKLNNSSDPPQPVRGNKTRKPSGAGLLTGIIGRRTTQPEQHDESSSQGTRSLRSQPQSLPKLLPPPRTYTDIEEHPTPVFKQAPPSPWLPHKNQSLEQDRERGRRTSRERQYPSVPIPGGYKLVRGEGAIPVPTEYDPRGLNHPQQVDPMYAHQDQGVYQNPVSLLGGAQPYGKGQPPGPHPSTFIPSQISGQGNLTPNFGTTELIESQLSHLPRRLSRDDILARSPARSPEGQQRPYELRLPGEEEDRDIRSTRKNKEMPIISPPSDTRPSVPISDPEKPPNRTIRRLAQPVIRHPQSPAGYPLPDDSVYSPVDPSAKDLPPPPAPKWPPLRDGTTTPSDLARSDTHQTSVSGVSQGSGASGQRSLLAVQDALDRASQRPSASPTPPSPGITPPPARPSSIQASSSSSSNPVPTTTTTSPTIAPPHPSPDLYTASPRLPKSKPLSPPPEIPSTENGAAELEDPESAALRARTWQEEKIPADADGEEDGEEEEQEEVRMSATSYPGQEWNPYAEGVYVEDYID